MFLEPWRALSGRIQGLVRAGQLCKESDSYGTLKHLGDHASKIIGELEKFRELFRQSLPIEAELVISECISMEAATSVAKLLADDTTTSDLRKQRIWSAIVLLAVFDTEMTFLLSDTQAAVRARSERAFSHLQRLIVVDSTIREQWKTALSSGEVACEKLGAVHLLLHGIWAFKISAAGERTDLVYQQPAGDLVDEQCYADGFVLTEWKVASSESEAQKRFAAARAQAKRYSQGVLAGSELTRFRYVIAVTAQHVNAPADISEGAIVYRHINIAVDPETPSQARPRPRTAR